MKLGDTLTLGRYADEPIHWIAIAEKEDSFLLLSRDILEYRPFHSVDGPVGEGDFTEGAYTASWPNCDLRLWLNGDFFTAAFTAEEAAHIPTCSLISPTDFRSLYSHFPGKKETEDRLFILTENEAKEYLTGKAFFRARRTPHALARYEAAEKTSLLLEGGAWWLRSYGSSAFSVYMRCVYNPDWSRTAASQCNAVVNAQDVGVRPAMWYRP